MAGGETNTGVSRNDASDDMAWIAGGRFRTGPASHYREEGPAHDVRIDGTASRMADKVGHDTRGTPARYFNAYAGLSGPPLQASAATDGLDKPGNGGIATVGDKRGWYECRGLLGRGADMTRVSLPAFLAAGLQRYGARFPRSALMTAITESSVSRSMPSCTPISGKQIGTIWLAWWNGAVVPNSA
jgi:hypothetical protein